MTVLRREPLMVYMPANVVCHMPRRPPLVSCTEATNVLRLPPLCRTRLPAFVCACGERRLILEWPDGRREWETEEGLFVLCLPRSPDHWTERREPATVEYPEEGSPEEGAFLAPLIDFCRREAARLASLQVAPVPDSRIGVTDEHGLRAVVEADTVEALMDYARRGNERDFRDLAAMCGVPLAQLDELWQGTCARLRSGGAP